MRKVVAYELLSLDGVAERPDGFFADWDEVPAMNDDRNVRRRLKTGYATIRRRHTALEHESSELHTADLARRLLGCVHVADLYQMRRFCGQEPG